MTANDARDIAQAARDSQITPAEQAAWDATIHAIEVFAKQGFNKVEINVPKQVDGVIRSRLRARGFKAEWGQMTANVTYIKVSWE